jgi:hypothetical protein
VTSADVRLNVGPNLSVLLTSDPSISPVSGAD